MLKSTEQKKRYVQKTRRQNYQASLKLEGLSAMPERDQQTKAEILEKYKKFSKPES